ncbi:hypothetical protein L195_g024180 [Trifolium pratense]|uniref:Ubiquitin-like domain-containing protein n=2 Tax=Trifolium pratense TaxID=57577 RepID=A0A2K3NCZ1_TRIPR|nr:hypothetical protein L195_g019179 [Trifolium pratense]PNY00893.1 hypothetical protein L195_g024180 [Trifolium pratense]CAJ2630135.1 unnamed protein product [Trifolium pratense]
MELLITKKRSPGSMEEDEVFTLEIAHGSTFEEVKESIKKMKGIDVKKQFLWCKDCSGTEFINSDNLNNPEVDPRNMVLFVNEDKVNVEVLLCPLVENNLWSLQLDLVDSISDLKALIKAQTSLWWNKEVKDYHKTIWMRLFGKDRTLLQDTELLETMQVRQIECDNTDTIQVYCDLKIFLYLKNKEEGGEFRNIAITVNNVNMFINIEFEVNKTVKDLKDTVSPLVQARFPLFWFWQNGAPLSEEILVKNLKSNEMSLTM